MLLRPSLSQNAVPLTFGMLVPTAGPAPHVPDMMQFFMAPVFIVPLVVASGLVVPELGAAATLGGGGNPPDVQ